MPYQIERHLVFNSSTTYHSAIILKKKKKMFWNENSFNLREEQLNAHRVTHVDRNRQVSRLIKVFHTHKKTRQIKMDKKGGGKKQSFNSKFIFLKTYYPTAHSTRFFFWRTRKIKISKRRQQNQQSGRHRRLSSHVIKDSISWWSPTLWAQFTNKQLYPILYIFLFKS